MKRLIAILSAFFLLISISTASADISTGVWLGSGSTSTLSTTTTVSSTIMYISTQNGGKLNLRQGPSINATSLGLFENGSAVQVIATMTDWAYVYVNNLYGYMMMEYLSYTPGSSSSPTPVSSTTMYVQTGNTGKLHLRVGPGTNYESKGLYPNGTAVTVVGLTTEWASVIVNGQAGFMMRKFLSTSGSITPVSPTEVPTPMVTFAPTSMYISTANGNNLILRRGPGTNYESLGSYPVDTNVIAAGYTGEWLYVTVNGKVGYMHQAYLKNGSVTPDEPTPVTPTTLYVSTGNTGKLHLRTSASQGSNSLGLFANGTAVVMTGKLGEWAYVTVGTKTGYMMLKYLTTESPYVPVPTPSDPTKAVVTQPHGNYVNMRSSRWDMDNSNVIAQLPTGTEVTVLEKGTPWSKIQYNELVGYMNSTYLVFAAAQ